MNQLIVARAISGVGGGGFNTLATIVLADMIPLRRRGTFQGYRDLVFAVGLGAGTCGGWVTERVGWRWLVFFSFWALSLVLAWVGMVCERREVSGLGCGVLMRSDGVVDV